MSKPEGMAGQSLEQILASIRRSLTEESPAALGLVEHELPFPEDRKAEPQAQPAPADGTASGNPLTDALTNRLAVALETPANGAPVEDDEFKSLLAVDPKDAPSPQAGVARPVPESPAPERDPLWFFGRKAAAKASPAPTSPASPLAAKPEPGEPQADIQLTRPQAVRATFPPLFSAKSEPVPTQPAEPAVSAEPAPAKPQGPKDKLASLSGGPQPQEPAPAVSSAPSVKDAAPQPDGVAAEPLRAARGVSPAPASPAPQANGAAAAAAPAAPAESEAAGKPAAAARNGPLEDMIAQVLEPVLQRLLDKNLTPLVERVVREEVARALQAERGAKST